jgi:hypothetical protein
MPLSLFARQEHVKTPRLVSICIFVLCRDLSLGEHYDSSQDF